MLGRGGMGVVYSARDERLDRTVAIKTDLRTGGRPEGARAIVARGARGGQRQPSERLPDLRSRRGRRRDLHRDGAARGRTARGEDRRAAPLPLGEAVRIALGVLAALEALHRRGIVHRDLKPSNVFLTPHGVKLLDFGLARPHAAESRVSETSGDALAITAAGVLVGTPRYMAPELWSGEAARPASDLFALGAMLFEILTGKPAFGGATILEVCRAVLNEHPPALSGGVGGGGGRSRDPSCARETPRGPLSRCRDDGARALERERGGDIDGRDARPPHDAVRRAPLSGAATRRGDRLPRRAA